MKIASVEAANAQLGAQSYTNGVTGPIAFTLATATSNITTLTTNLGQLSSTGYLTLTAYSSFSADLSKAQAQTVNSGTTLFTIAAGLNITTEKTNFTTAVASLSSSLSPFSGASFPAVITTNQ